MKLKLKIIALILIQSFLLLDFAWCGGNDICSTTAKTVLSPQVSLNAQDIQGSFSFILKITEPVASKVKTLSQDLKKPKKMASYFRNKMLYIAGALILILPSIAFSQTPGLIHQFNNSLHGIPLLATVTFIVYVATACMILLLDWIFDKVIRIRSERIKRILNGLFTGQTVGLTTIFFARSIREVINRNMLIVPAIFLGLSWFVLKAVKEYKKSVYFGIPSSKLKDDSLKEPISNIKFMKFAELPFDLAIVVIWSLIPRINQFFVIVPLFLAAIRYVITVEARHDFEAIEKHITKKYGTPENFLKKHFEGVDLSRVSEKDKRSKLFKIIAESSPPIVALSIDRHMRLNFHDKECYNAEKFFPWFSPIFNLIYKLSPWKKKKAPEAKTVKNGVRLNKAVTNKAQASKGLEFYLRPNVSPVIATNRETRKTVLFKKTAALPAIDMIRPVFCFEILNINRSI